MKIGTKLLIIMAAMLLTFFGFNLIASSGAVDLVKVGKQAGYEIIANVLTKAENSSQPSRIKG